MNTSISPYYKAPSVDAGIKNTFTATSELKLTPRKSPIHSDITKITPTRSPVQNITTEPKLSSRKSIHATTGAGYSSNVDVGRSPNLYNNLNNHMHDKYRRDPYLEE